LPRGEVPVPRLFLGVFLGITLTLGGALAAVPLWQWWVQRAPRVAHGTTLVLKVQGDLPEALPVDLSLFGEPPDWSFYSLLACLKKASADARIAAIVFEPAGMSSGWAKLAELRGALEAFARTGKPLVAVLRTPATRDYYVASAASRIVVAPGDYLNIKGLRVELLYARQALDKLGIVPEFESIGRYKDGPDILTRSSMTPTTAEVMNGILDERYRELTGTIARARHKESAEVRALLDHGPFLSQEALKAGLVDRVQFQAALEAELASTLKQKELNKLDAALYQRVSARSLGLEGGHRIALVVASGEISRSGSYDLSEVLRPAPFLALLKEVREDRGIRGVVLRIDSPGGDAVASGEMLAALRELARVKPLVASVSDLAASGGYELAIGAPWIVAHPQSLTGSIGIFYGKLNLVGFYAKLGMSYEVLSRGSHATMDSTVMPLDPSARRRVHEMLDAMYRDFVTDVAQARNRSFAEIDSVAQGRVWTGGAALAAGLVDELGGLESALNAVRQRAGLANNEKIRVEVYPKAPDLISHWRQRLEAVPMVLNRSASFNRELPFRIEVQ
jgi:protease IV